MQSRYRHEQARSAIATYERAGEDLALRVYTSRLLGADPSLVLSGGGNTSVKTRVTDIFGQPLDVLCVKGSGWDLASIEPPGFPACELSTLLRLCKLPAMTDDQMVAELRRTLLEPTAPTPSVEALMHAYLPAKFIDHTHADAVLRLVDQPNSESLVREVFGDRALFIPYVMPGFLLAQKVAELWDQATKAGREVELMILDKHGIFTWGETAEASYERMIAAVTKAEEAVATRLSDRAFSARVASFSAAPNSESQLAEIAAIVRGELGRAWGKSIVVRSRRLGACGAIANHPRLDDLAKVGCITPDHVIRTKSWPLLMTPQEDDAASRAHTKAALEAYRAHYDAYFAEHQASQASPLEKLDPFPRLAFVRGLGALAFGKTPKEADIALDIAEHWAEVAADCDAQGGFEPVGDRDRFDVEYWSLEQAKLKRGATAPGRLQSKIAVVTGAASGIGLATAKQLLAEGACVLLLDKNEEELERVMQELRTKLGSRIAHAVCDVTDENEVERAVLMAASTFGGLDIVVSNAGFAWTGDLMEEEGFDALEQSFALNFWSHHHIARAAVGWMKRQGVGGTLLFNASKSAFNQGPAFGPYAIPKAALVSLVRQYAVDLAPLGIRANAINADRIRTKLFDGGMLERRCKARGLTVEEYFRANLLSRETTADDVANAFVYLASAEATTGCVVTVDGGNAAAFVR